MLRRVFPFFLMIRIVASCTSVRFDDISGSRIRAHSTVLVRREMDPLSPRRLDSERGHGSGRTSLPGTQKVCRFMSSGKTTAHAILGSINDPGSCVGSTLSRCPGESCCRFPQGPGRFDCSGLRSPWSETPCGGSEIVNEDERLPSFRDINCRDPRVRLVSNAFGAN